MSTDSPNTTNTFLIPLRPNVTCPHCWSTYPSEKTRWIAEHEQLRDDPRLGPEAQQRFTPTRFNLEGDAIDLRGQKCQRLACPECHLPVPQALYDMACHFYSILGTPSCGKSYFLASMSWQLRQALPRNFQLSWSDCDPTSNALLNEYERVQFFNEDREAVVKLAKTETQGDLYDSVRYGEQIVDYPRPFLFTIRPLPEHPNHHESAKLSRVVCLYDNAGESFEPGTDTASSPVTRHLARSQCLFFLFDPTQDPRFREACQGVSTDRQITSGKVVRRQDLVLSEAADRVRKYAGLKSNEQHQRPLIVVVTKSDAWLKLLDEDLTRSPWRVSNKGNLCAIDLDRIDSVSAKVRDILWKFSPEIVSAATGFAKQVCFLPVSATGTGPVVDPVTGVQGIRPRDIKPQWVEVPMLLALSKFSGGGMIPYFTTRAKS